MTAKNANKSKSLTNDRRLKLPSPDEYAKFIKGLELVDVRLVSSEALSNAIRPEASTLDLRVRYTSDITRLDSAESYSFEAYPGLEVNARQAGLEEPVGLIKVRFGLRYQSKLQPTAGYLDVFSKVNLQVNAWPYLREFVHQTVTRFGWTPLVLPTLKTTPPTRPSDRQP